jgi:pimeloyl-ACP methyl ester carboxylesterase
MTDSMRIDNNGIQLNVEAEGRADAPVVLFLHGVTSSARTWAWLPSDLKQGRRILRMDMRGHGASDHAPGTYNVTHYGSDVVAVLRKISARPAVLVGHSLGAVVAWWAAQHHPELVAAALLEDPPLFENHATEEQKSARLMIFGARRAIALEARQSRLSEQEVGKRIAATPVSPDGNIKFGDLWTDDVACAMGYGHARMDIGVLDAAIDDSTLADVDTESPVGPPILLLAADDAAGAVFRSADIARLARTHPAVQVARITGSGHGIHDERRFRETFVEHLRRFLDRHAPAR